MEFRMRATTTFAADTMMLDDPQLRLFDMKPRVMTDAVEWSDNDKDSLNHHRYYLPTAWKPSTKANASNFSAVAWYFGKMLRAQSARRHNLQRYRRFRHGIMDRYRDDRARNARNARQLA